MGVESGRIDSKDAKRENRRTPESGRIDSKDAKRENRRTHGEEENGNLGKKLQAPI